jgi:hypothetical protein
MPNITNMRSGPFRAKAPLPAETSQGDPGRPTVILRGYNALLYGERPDD